MTEAAFIQLLTRNQQRLGRLCSLYANDPADQQDLFSEIVLRLWESVPSFREEASIDTWLYRVALNTALRFRFQLHKKAKRHSSLKTIEFLPAPDTYQQQQYEALRSCIRRLNEADRPVVTLFLEGFAYKEIAEVLGISENGVAVKMKRIRKKLFACINALEV